MVFYHGTSKVNEKSIKENGFKKSYGRFGTAVYFSNIKSEAENFNKNIITINIPNEKIILVEYESLIKFFPDLNIEEEEGATELEKFNKPAIAVKYNDGSIELCVYDTSLIAI